MATNADDREQEYKARQIELERAPRRRKTNPDHKASFRLAVVCNCSCGWTSSTWLGQGARRNAAGEWRSHREKCEASILAAADHNQS